MAEQYVATSRLANVIQLISLGRQSGILRAVRGHGATREMGQIQFIEGQPTAALLGQLTGSTAMNVLTNWGESYYTFDESDQGTEDRYEPSAGAPPAYGVWPSGDAGWNAGSAYGQAGGGSFPSAPSGGMPGSWPGRATSGSLGYSGQTPPPSSPPPYTPTPAPGYGAGTSARLGGGYGMGPSANGPAGQPSSQPGPSGQTAAVYPRRTMRSDATDTLPLDRRERMILLLVDGRRSVADLGRLTRRNDDEVMAVLGNLKMLGLIE